MKILKRVERWHLEDEFIAEWDDKAGYVRIYNAAGHIVFDRTVHENIWRGEVIKIIENYEVN